MFSGPLLTTSVRVSNAGRLARRLALAGLFSLALVVSGTVVIPPSFEKLVNDSDFVVRAKVKSVTSEHVTANSRRIVSHVELEVSETIAGTAPQPLVLRVLGGKVGNQEMFIEGAPQFVEGDEAIFFVHGNGQLAYPLVAIMHGLYPIDRDRESGREFMTRSDRQPLQSTAEVAQPLHENVGNAARTRAATRALTPAQFADQIRAAVKPDNARLHAK